MSIMRELNISLPDDVEPDNRTPSDSPLPAWLRGSPLNTTEAETLPHDLFRMTPPPKRKCYVGMTTDLAQRRKEHELRYEIHKWQLHDRYYSKTAAQAAENQLAKNLKANGFECHSHPGGAGDEFAIWYVYSFEYKE